MSAVIKVEDLRARLLAWYDTEGRSLPWRIRPEDRAAGMVPDPYAIWLSEIMLQQTTVPHATPYWHDFLARWPRVEDLANAPREDVMAAWAGLGYYARARNLYACAQVVAFDLDGNFPDTIEALRALPGVGEYTSHAIGAAAFNRPANVVDGNVERAISRLYALETPLPKSKPEIRALAGEIADHVRSHDYAQAIMDLGAIVCSPKSPSCQICPWQSACKAYALGEPTAYPKKLPKKAKPQRYGHVFLIHRDGQFYVRPRPDQGLLGGMLELPGGLWSEQGLPTRGEAEPFAADWQPGGEVSHVFTHFTLQLQVWCAEAPKDYRPNAGHWADLKALKTVGLPSVMAKAAQAGLKAISPDA